MSRYRICQLCLVAACALLCALSSAAFSAISSLPPALSGTASGALWTFQNLGGSIGLAVVGTIFRHAERTSLMTGLGASDIHLTQKQQDLIRSLLGDSNEARQILAEFPSSLAESIWPLFRSAFMLGYSWAFLFLLGLSLAAFLVVAVLSSHLSTRVRQQAAELGFGCRHRDAPPSRRLVPQKIYYVKSNTMPS